MIEFNSFLKENIAVSFNEDPVLFRQELITFLSLCESHDIKWCSGDPAVSCFMLSPIIEGRNCVSYFYGDRLTEGGNDVITGLCCGMKESYLKEGYTIIPSTDFSISDEIKRFASFNLDKLNDTFLLLGSSKMQ